MPLLLLLLLLMLLLFPTADCRLDLDETTSFLGSDGAEDGGVIVSSPSTGRLASQASQRRRRIGFSNVQLLHTQTELIMLVPYIKRHDAAMPLQPITCSVIQ